jgi:hypothetical protein
MATSSIEDKKYIHQIRLFSALAALFLVIISCEAQKQSTAVAPAAISGRWNHQVPGQDNSVVQLSFAFFDDSTYYLTQNIPFEHSSGNFIIKKDTLILYKDVPSAANFSFIIELKKDTLLFDPINENDHLKYKDFTGYWLSD